MRAILTKLVVERAEIKSLLYTIWDVELKGFGVKVQASGRKTYFAYYCTQSGQQRKPAIGSHGKVTTEEARQIVKKWIAASVSGVDISLDRRKARAAPIMRYLAQKYLDDFAACFKKASSFKSDQSNLNNHVLPLIRTKKV